LRAGSQRRSGKERRNVLCLFGGNKGYGRPIFGDASRRGQSGVTSVAKRWGGKLWKRQKMPARRNIKGTGRLRTISTINLGERQKSFVEPKGGGAQSYNNEFWRAETEGRNKWAPVIGPRGGVYERS